MNKRSKIILSVATILILANNSLAKDINKLEMLTVTR